MQGCKVFEERYFAEFELVINIKCNDWYQQSEHDTKVKPIEYCFLLFQNFHFLRSLRNAWSVMSIFMGTIEILLVSR